MPLSNVLQPGKMRHRIQIVVPSGVQDDFGGVADAGSAWTVVLTCWAQIEALSGRDQFAAGTFVSSISHKITIRYPRETATVDSSCRVWFRGRVFIVEAVLNPDETNKLLILMVKEVDINLPAVPNAGLDK